MPHRNGPDVFFSFPGRKGSVIIIQLAAQHQFQTHHHRLQAAHSPPHPRSVHSWRRSFRNRLAVPAPGNNNSFARGGGLTVIQRPPSRGYLIMYSHGTRNQLIERITRRRLNRDLQNIPLQWKWTARGRRRRETLKQREAGGCCVVAGSV